MNRTTALFMFGIILGFAAGEQRPGHALPTDEFHIAARMGDPGRFRRRYHYSLALSATLATGWLGAAARLRKARRAGTRKKECRRRASAEERRLMTEISRRVIDRKEYLHPGLTLGDLSDRLGLNMASVSRAVNSITGRHFCRWLNEIRIGEAVVRLSDPARTCNFTEIAYDVGFNDRTTFFRAFKQITGTSPRDFCRSIEKKRCDS